MRLGGFYHAERIEDLEPLCAVMDTHGLSALQAPRRLAEMTDDDCVAFGDRARELGLVVGEAGMWQNLMSLDRELQAERIELVRTLLRKADLMGCRCVVTLVGSRDPSDHALAPSAEMLQPHGRKAFREVVLRIMDGLDLELTTYAIEPWPTTFFHQPEEIADFLADLGDARVGLHLDLANMVSPRTYFDTRGLITRVFDLLRHTVRSVHLKDILWDPKHMLLRLDEVLIGNGLIDYETYLAAASGLSSDTTCFCEHLRSEEEYAENFARLHERAKAAGSAFLPRTP